MNESVIPTEIDPRLFSILAHSLGRQEDGQRKEDQLDSDRDYRNSFVTSTGSSDYAHCMALVELGLMHKTTSVLLSEGSFFFFVTEAGIQLVNHKAATAKANMPKLTRSQARYRRYVKFRDVFNSFLEFCRWDAENEKRKKLSSSV